MYTREQEAVTAIPIGIVGPNDFMPKMRELLKRFPTFQPIVKGYGNVDEAPSLAAALMPQVEVLLFTGPVPYVKAREAIPFTVPVHYVPLTGAGLYRALFELQRRLLPESATIDTLPLQIVQNTIRDLGIDRLALIHAGDDVPVGTEPLVRFHEAQYRSGRSQAAITGLRSVADALTAAGVPNVWVAPTDPDVVVALERALLSTETRRSKEAQIVLGLIHVDDVNHNAAKLGSEHEIQKQRIELSMLLLHYVESLDGHLTHFGGDEYLFVTTRGRFEKETGGYKSVPLAGDVKKSFGLTLSIGIGFGRSASEAGTHARTALRHARDAGGSSCFIVREDGGVIGPLEMERPKPYDLSLLGPALLAKSESAGMSAAYLSRLATQAAHKGKIEYFAQELASVLGITVRSVHRCLLQWLDGGLVEIVGEERWATKGRPRHIYRFTFLEDHLYRKES